MTSGFRHFDGADLNIKRVPLNKFQKDLNNKLPKMDSSMMSNFFLKTKQSRATPWSTYILKSNLHWSITNA